MCHRIKMLSIFAHAQTSASVQELIENIVSFVAGLQFGVSQWILSDTGPSVQTDRIHSELLHSSGSDDTHIHVDRPAFGSEETKPTDGHHAHFESSK